MASCSPTDEMDKMWPMLADPGGHREWPAPPNPGGTAAV